jgi:hypothetical protein
MKGLGAIATLVAVVCAPIEAQALCTYDGVDNAKTTLAQEFRDSKWVVRARVVSAADHLSDTTESWTTYRLELRRVFKGRPPARLRFFTYRDSGGFYMDRPWVNLPPGHDIGGEYLLFLDPIPPYRGRPAAAKGSVFVNYNCGQSRAWSAVDHPALSLLAALARGD